MERPLPPTDFYCERGEQPRTLVAESSFGQLEVVVVYLGTDAITTTACGRSIGGAGSHERVQNRVARKAEHANQTLGQLDGIGCRVVARGSTGQAGPDLLKPPPRHRCYAALRSACCRRPVCASAWAVAAHVGYAGAVRNARRRRLARNAGRRPFHVAYAHPPDRGRCVAGRECDSHSRVGTSSARLRARHQYIPERWFWFSLDGPASISRALGGLLTIPPLKRRI